MQVAEDEPQQMQDIQDSYDSQVIISARTQGHTSHQEGIGVEKDVEIALPERSHMSDEAHAKSQEHR